MVDVLTRRLSGRKPESDLSGRTVGSSGGFIWMEGCSTRRSIRATVPAAPTPLVQSAPPAATRAPNQLGYHLPYTIPLLPYTHPSPLPLLPLCPTAPYHAVSWYIPSMRTRVPSFGQTFPNKVGPCQNTVFCIVPSPYKDMLYDMCTLSGAGGRRRAHET